MPSVTLAKKFEKSVRTKAWMTYLLNETGAVNPHQLARLFLKKGEMDTEVKAGSKWSEYGAGNSSPYPSTLVRVNAQVPGAEDVYQNGPENSYLFTSMWSDLSEIHDLLSESGLGISHSFFWLNQLLPYGYLRQTDDEGLKAVIGGMAKLLDEDKFARDGIQELGTLPTRLSFVSGCFAILRFCIDRDNYHRYSYVFETVDLIIQCTVKDDFSESLKKVGVEQDIFSRLYSILSEWSEYSQSGIYYRYNARFPNENEFLANPEIFHQRYKEIKFSHDENSAEFYIDLQESEVAADNEAYLEAKFA